jgi:hypothetical protein
MNGSEILGAVIAGVILQLVIGLVGYGALREKVAGLERSFKETKDTISAALTGVGLKCEKLEANDTGLAKADSEIAQRVARIEGSRGSGGRDCSEKPEGVQDRINDLKDK